MSPSILRLTFILCACFASMHCALAEPVINEFLADNTGGEGALLDLDGDSPDWIEIRNAGSTTTNLAGWHLTDDVAVPAKWTFPAVTMQPGAMLVVFASAKNRALAGTELHTNFSLNAGGEYLALTRPDNTIASAFAPAYSAQREGVSHGIGRQVISPSLLSATSPAKVLVQTAPAPSGWQGESFNDAAWTAAQAAVGYDDGTAGNAALNLLGYWNFDYPSNLSVASDLSGNANHGTVTGATFTAPGAGRSGASGGSCDGFPARRRVEDDTGRECGIGRV